jgi:hypothetical protein
LDRRHLQQSAQATPVGQFHAHGLRNEMDISSTVGDYHEHALTAGSEALAVAYVEAAG